MPLADQGDRNRFLKARPNTGAEPKAQAIDTGRTPRSSGEASLVLAEFWPGSRRYLFVANSPMTKKLQAAGSVPRKLRAPQASLELGVGGRLRIAGPWPH